LGESKHLSQENGQQSAMPLITESAEQKKSSSTKATNVLTFPCMEKSQEHI